MADYADREKASEALQAWFISQDVTPSDAVMICEQFIARMAVINATDSENLERKLRLCDSAVRAYCAKLILDAQ